MAEKSSRKAIAKKQVLTLKEKRVAKKIKKADKTSSFLTPGA